ncbi:MAG: EcoRI family type II restriction endonuclease [Candidatus Binataceae bacterium]
MGKGQAGRLSKQHVSSGGPKGTFGQGAQVHDRSVHSAGRIVLDALQREYPQYQFRVRDKISKQEINKKLQTIDGRLGKMLFVKDSSIKPDGGIIEVQDKAQQWRVVLVSEAKYQGKDVENIKAGVLVGKNKDQDLTGCGKMAE